MLVQSSRPTQQPFRSSCTASLTEKLPFGDWFVECMLMLVDMPYLQRARHWAEKMDMMGFERLRLAAMLMDSLDSIEQESGLFLIKPMYSYRGR